MHFWWCVRLLAQTCSSCSGAHRPNTLRLVVGDLHDSTFVDIHASAIRLLSCKQQTTCQDYGEHVCYLGTFKAH